MDQLARISEEFAPDEMRNEIVDNIPATTVIMDVVSGCATR